MSRSATGDLSWAEMTTAQKAEAVLNGHATLRQVVEGLLDGSDQLREACREFLARADASLKEIRLEDDATGDKGDREPDSRDTAPYEDDNNADTPLGQSKRRRHGLPPGYKPRSHRHDQLDSSDDQFPLECTLQER
jgi:hypothetical protein